MDGPALMLDIVEPGFERGEHAVSSGCLHVGQVVRFAGIEATSGIRAGRKYAPAHRTANTKRSFLSSSDIRGKDETLAEARRRCHLDLARLRGLGMRAARLDLEDLLLAQEAREARGDPEAKHTDHAKQQYPLLEQYAQEHHMSVAEAAVVVITRQRSMRHHIAAVRRAAARATLQIQRAESRETADQALATAIETMPRVHSAPDRGAPVPDR